MTDPKAPPGIVAFIGARQDANEKLAREAMHYGYNSGLRLLAYVTAHRAVLLLHRSRGQNLLGHPVCDECTPVKEYPCQTVRLLAAIDADHPDYDPEWKPQAETSANTRSVWVNGQYIGQDPSDSDTI